MLKRENFDSLTSAEIDEEVDVSFCDNDYHVDEIAVVKLVSNMSTGSTKTGCEINKGKKIVEGFHQEGEHVNYMEMVKNVYAANNLPLVHEEFEKEILEELQTPRNSDDEDPVRIKQFKKETDMKDFKWEVGLAFGSTEDAKQAIREYGVVN